MTSTRVFIMEGTLQKISGSHDQERHIFLFNDCFMYCKKKGNDQYICKGIIYLHQIEVEEEDEVSWKLKRNDKNLMYKFYGKTAKEKQLWLAAIREQQEKYNSTKVKPPPRNNRSLVHFFGSFFYSEIPFCFSETRNCSSLFCRHIQNV